MQEALRKNYKIHSEPVYCEIDKTMNYYVPKEIRCPSDAYAASLDILLKHVADFHLIMLEILSEKYGHSVDEMLLTCNEDKRFQDMVAKPVVNTLGYFEPVKEEAPPVATAPAAMDVEEVTEALNDLVVSAPKKRKKIVVKPPTA